MNTFIRQLLKRRLWRYACATISACALVSTSVLAQFTPTQTQNLVQGTLTGEGSGEVVDAVQVSSDYFIAVTDNPNGGVTIYKWNASSSSYIFDRSINILSQVTDADSVTSVALDPRGNGIGVAAVQVDDPAGSTVTDDNDTPGNTGDDITYSGASIPQIGSVVFFDVTTGTILGTKQAGYNPDMVTISTNGYCAVANEAEYAWSDDEDNLGRRAFWDTFQQNGSVSIYNLNTGASIADIVTNATELEIDFTNSTLTGIRFGTAEAIEPEYIAFDGNTMFVGCQENNAIAILADVTTATTSSAFVMNDLGFETYTADVSNRDSGINIAYQVKGLRMPDGFAVYNDGATTYVITADEGDARPDDSDIERAGDFENNVAATPVYDDGNGVLTQSELNSAVADNAMLGRINILIEESTNGSGELEDIFVLGTRGTTIFSYNPTGSTLTRVAHQSFEQFIATNDPLTHNANDGGDLDEVDARSDDKGPEPEAVTVVKVGGTPFALVGNERQNGLVLVDISTPASPAIANYSNNRETGLNSPETAATIPASASPTGAPLAVVGYEGDSGISGSFGVYNFADTNAFTLTILHNNDGESDLLSYQGDTDYGNIARFASAVSAHEAFYGNLGHGVIKVFAGDSFLAGAEFQASLDQNPDVFFDALALSRIGYDALTIGNHELDFGPDILADFISQAQTTNPSLYLSANLDFTNEANLLAQETAGNIASSVLLTVPTASGTKQVGIIGATTENLPFISSPRNIIISSVATAVNAQIASLTTAGADAIILVSHLQGIDEDIALIPSLAAGIDLIVAGGGDELLGDTSAASPRSTYGTSAPASIVDTNVYPGADDTIGTGDDDTFFDVDGVTAGVQSDYPYVSTNTDLGGNTIPVVTGAGGYGYLGRITLEFDGLGGITVDTTSNPALIVAESLDATNGYALNSEVVDDTVTPVQNFVDGLAATTIGEAAQTLVQSSDLVRSAERAIGNLVADAYLAAAQANAAGFGVDSPQIALVNGGGIRAPIPAGNITLATTFAVSPFGNFVSVVEDVTTADLKLLLENAYSRTVDNDPSNNIDPARQGGGTGRFAQVAGMSVTYDISNPALVLDAGTNSITTQGTRVINATLDDGTPLIVNGVPVAGVTVDITLPTFNANGGDQYFRYVGGGTNFYTSASYPFTTLGITDQQALANYITGLGTSVGNEIDLDARYDNVMDGRVVTTSDLDNDGLSDPIEELLGTNSNDTVNPDTALLNNPAQFAAAITAAQTAQQTIGQNNVVNNPLSFYDEIVAAAPSLVTEVRGDILIGTVVPPTALATGTADFTFSLFQAPTPGGTYSEVPGTAMNLQITLPAGTNTLFFQTAAQP